MVCNGLVTQSDLSFRDGYIQHLVELQNIPFSRSVRPLDYPTENRNEIPHTPCSILAEITSGSIACAGIMWLPSTIWSDHAFELGRVLRGSFL